MLLQLLTSFTVYLVMQPVLLIRLITNRLYFIPDCIQLPMIICDIQKMPFCEGLILPS